MFKALWITFLVICVLHTSLGLIGWGFLLFNGGIKKNNSFQADNYGYQRM